MLKEQEITIDFGDESRTYCIKQLELEASQEVLVRLLKLLGGAGGIDDTSFQSLPARLKVDDINFLRNKLLGANCLYLNESGNYVPMGKALVESHFAGRLGLLLHLLVITVKHNFSDFLADLRLDDILGATDLD